MLYAGLWRMIKAMDSLLLRHNKLLFPPSHSCISLATGKPLGNLIKYWEYKFHNPVRDQHAIKGELGQGFSILNCFMLQLAVIQASRVQCT